MKYTLIGCILLLLLSSCMFRRGSKEPYTQVVTEVKGYKFKVQGYDKHWLIMIHRWTPKVGDTLYYNYPDSIMKREYEKWKADRAAEKLAAKNKKKARH